MIGEEIHVKATASQMRSGWRRTKGGWQAKKKTHWRVVPLIMSTS
jgi:hypothetical protein